MPQSERRPRKKRAVGRPAIPEADRLRVNVLVRLKPADKKRLDTLVAKLGQLGGMARPASIGRMAMLMGIAVLEHDLENHQRRSRKEAPRPFFFEPMEAEATGS